MLKSNRLQIRDFKQFNFKLLEFMLFICLKVLLSLFLVDYYEIYAIEFYSTIYKVIVGWVVYLIIVTIAIFKLDKIFYSVAYKFLFLLGGVSSIVIFEQHDISTFDFAKAALYWILLLIAFIFFQNSAHKKTEYLQFSKIPNLQIYLLIFSLFFAIVMSGIYSGFRFTISLTDIYSYRMEMREVSMPAIIRYLFIFVGGAILPYCFSYFLTRKAYLLVGISFIAGVLIFSINGMKTWLISYLLIIGVFITIKLNKDKIIPYVLLFLCGSIILSLYLYRSSDNIILTALLGRTIYLPSKIGYNYITFFDQNHFLFLRESILSSFFDPPYPVNSAFYIVGGDFTDIYTSRANNGLWGDAYANFGLIGIVIYPIVLAYILRVLERTMIGQDIRLLFSITFILLWSAVNISFFTWLVTGGVIIFLFINKLAKRKILIRAV